MIYGRLARAVGPGRGPRLRGLQAVAAELALEGPAVQLERAATCAFLATLLLSVLGRKLWTRLWDALA
jgi:hypothetical protein